jgi:transposase
MQVTTIGLDLAKHVFQIHGIDAAEKVVVRRQLRRSQVMAFFEALAPCRIGMEACATAHYWARELTKLGHEVRLMPAKAVKAYVKRNKNDAAHKTQTPSNRIRPCGELMPPGLFGSMTGRPVVDARYAIFAGSRASALRSDFERRLDFFEVRLQN